MEEFDYESDDFKIASEDFAQNEAIKREAEASINGSIFDGATFGTMFLTRCDYKAVYIGKSKLMHLLIIEGNDEVDYFFSTGGFSLSGKEHPYDIIKKI